MSCSFQSFELGAYIVKFQRISESERPGHRRTDDPESLNLVDQYPETRVM